MQFRDKTAYVWGLRYRWDPSLSRNPVPALYATLLSCESDWNNLNCSKKYVGKLHTSQLKVNMKIYTESVTSVCIKFKVNAKLFASGISQCVAICEKSGVQSVAQQIWLRNMRGAPGLDLICGQTKALQWGRLRNIDKNPSKKKMDKIDRIHVTIYCQWYPHHQPRWHGSNMGGLSSCRGWWIMIAIRLFRKSCSQ